MPKILLTLINIYLSAIISRVWKRIYNKFDECKEKMFAMYSIKCLLKDLERLLNGKTMLFSQPPVIFQSAFIWLNHRASSCITIQVNIYLNTSMWHFHDSQNSLFEILYFKQMFRYHWPIFWHIVVIISMLLFNVWYYKV